MQRVTIYPNIYKCVSDYMNICHDRFWTFYGHFANEPRKLRIDKTKWEQFPRNTPILQNVIWMIQISFRQKRLPCWSVSDCLRLINCLYRKQLEKYSAKWDRGFIRASQKKEILNCLHKKNIHFTNLKNCEYKVGEENDLTPCLFIWNFCQKTSTRLVWRWRGAMA